MTTLMAAAGEQDHQALEDKSYEEIPTATIFLLLKVLRSMLWGDDGVFCIPRWQTVY